MSAGEQAPEGENRQLAWAALLSIAAVVVYVAVRELGMSAYDDSYFFKRFGLHAIEHGVYAWNLEDGPVHGSTSQLFQWLTTLVVLGTKTHVVGALRVVDAACLLAAAALCLRVVPRSGRAVVVLLSCNALVLSGIRSNMETLLAVAVLAGVLSWQIAAPPQRRGGAGAALGTVVVYLARPDAALIVAVFVVLDALFCGRRPWRYLGVLGGSMAIVLGSLWLYYGTALPLSFHVKTLGMHSYGAQIDATRWIEKTPYIGAIVAVAAPLGWALVRARVWARRDRVLALTIAGLCFFAYHAVSTTEIMGYRARFYVPCLVPLGLAAASVWPKRTELDAGLWRFLGLWAAALALAYQVGAVPNGTGFFLSVIDWPAYAGLVVATVVAAAAPTPWRAPGAAACLLVGTAMWLPLERPTLRSDRDIMFRHGREVTTTRGVFDVARCLPAGSTVYHSEMGVPGLVLYRMRVVDLAGLLSADVAASGLDFERRCSQERPEAIFLPHKNYVALNAEIAASACFSDYVRIVDVSSSALHVRGDLADDFLACGVEYREWVQAPGASAPTQ